MADQFEMNVYINERFHHTVEMNVLHYDEQSHCRICEVDGIFYVVDCEGDAQQRGTVGVALQSVLHAFTLLEFIKLETLYFFNAAEPRQ